MDHEIGSHRNIKIFLNANSGYFYTKDDSEIGHLSAERLDELRTKIDRQGKAKRLDQKCIMLGNSYDDEPKFREGIVTTITEDSGYSNRPVCWVSWSKNHRTKESAGYVYLDTPANRILVKAWVKTKAEERRLAKECEQIRAKIKHFELPPPKKAITLTSKVKL